MRVFLCVSVCAYCLSLYICINDEEEMGWEMVTCLIFPSERERERERFPEMRRGGKSAETQRREWDI